MDYVYKADLDPSEHAMGMLCVCNKCDFEDYLDVLVYAGHSLATWTWTCPKCGAKQDSDISTDKIFD